MKYTLFAAYLIFSTSIVFSQELELKQGVIFDDFSYSTTEFPVSGDSTNSLYGKNIWLTGNGSISTKAWHRYNWGDPDIFGANSGIIPHRNGITLYANEGFRFGQLTPMIMSGFLLKQGTYISRVRFSALPPQTLSIQAYWLFSPDSYRFKSGSDSITYLNEVDFEWNNWFMGRGEKRVNATTIAAVHSKKGNIMDLNEMHFFQYDESGRLLDIGKDVDSTPEYYFENRWFYYLIRLDSTRKTAEFLMESAEEGNVEMAKVYAGATKEESGNILPLTIHKYYPEVPLMTVYNFGTSSTSKDSVLKAPMKMDVDWFYFTPGLEVSIGDVVKEILDLRSKNISRLNTVGAQMNYDISKPHTAIITGPDSLRTGTLGQWTVEPSLKNTGYEIEYTYRFKNSARFDDWTFADTRTISLSPKSDTQEIELKAIVKNFWTRETVTVTKTVKILP
jgi:hypothetical protein